MKRGLIGLTLFLMLIVPFVSAGFFSDLFKKDVQLAPSGTEDFRVEVGNAAPTVTIIEMSNPVDLVPTSTRGVSLNFSAEDQNGAGDLDNSSVTIIFNFNSGAEIRSGGIAQCPTISTNAGLNRRYYNCTVDMQYFDAAGVWNVEVNVSDSTGPSRATDTTSFTVNQLKDISLSPATINFPSVVQGGSDIVSSVDTTVTNNGNFEVPSDGNLSITSAALVGETTPAENIPATNFRSAGSSGAATVCSTGTVMTGSPVSVTSVSLSKGSGGNTETIRHCLTSVPGGISSQFYSTTAGGTLWTFSI